MGRRALQIVLAAVLAGVPLIALRSGRPAAEVPSAPAVASRPPASARPTQVAEPSRVPVLRVTSEEAPSSPIAIESARYQVDVVGVVARTRATLTFRNDARRVLEGELVYPLPEGAVLSGFALDVGGRMVDGVVVEAERARVAFETEVRRGIDPGLAEFVRGNTFRTRVWPIPAGGRRTVRVEYLADLPERASEGVALYELPLRLGAQLEDFSLRVEVVRGDAAPVVRSGPANLAFERWEDRFVAETSRRDVAPQDLVLALPRLPSGHVSVETEENGDTYFVVDDVPAPPAEAAGAARPSRIGVLWDASLSRARADRERDLGLLRAHLARLGEVEVVAVVFRDVAEAPRSFRVRSGDARALVEALRAAPCDGATNLSGLPAIGDVAYTLLFSDGHWTVGASPAVTAPRPIYTIAGSSEADHGLLAAMAAASGGAAFNLLRSTDEEVLDRLGRPVYSLMAVTSDGGVADVEPRIPQPVNGRVTVAGRLTAPAARIELRYGWGRGGAVQVRGFDLRREGRRSSGLAARRWAERRLAALGLAPEANRDAITAIGRRFSIVTPGTSLLVLETLDQYLTHGIEPPESLPDLRRAYAARQDEVGRAKAVTRTAKLDRVLAMWGRRVDWWSRTFAVEEGFRYREPASPRRVAAEADAGGPPPPPSAAPAAPPAMRPGGTVQVSAAEQRQLAVARDAARESVATDAASPAGPTIAVAPWNPDTPYLRTLARVPAAEAYAAYLSERDRFGSSPAFFLDCADFFARRGDRALAIRVLSAIAELGLEDARLLRTLAHRMEQIDELDTAIGIFERVRRLRGEEPQSHRDLALALDRRALQRDAGPAAAADHRRALALLAEVVMGEWDNRFPEVEVTALEEANRIASLLERRGERVDWPLDPRLRQLLDADVRVVLTWDTDLTDMDLWVTEPSGEKCFYGHAQTTIGGLISRDFTGGLGPEVYAVRRALAGDYRVQANFYGSRAQSLTGPTTVQAVVFTGFGRPDEARRAVTLRLSGASEVVEVATVSFGGGAPKR